MQNEAFLKNAQAMLIVCNDEWTRKFTASLIEQINAGKNLSEKQISTFNSKLDAILSPAKIDDSLLFKINSLKNKTKSKWLLSFLDSISSQLSSGQPLTEKQASVLNGKYNRLILKIKPEKDDLEDEFDI